MTKASPRYGPHPEERAGARLEGWPRARSGLHGSRRRNRAPHHEGQESDAFRSGRSSALHRGGRDAQHHQRRGNGFISRWPRRVSGSRDWRTALGVALLTRGRRGVELTPAGESLLDHARIVLHNVEAMRGDLAGLCPWREGHRPLPRQHVGAFGISAEGAGCLPGRASRTFRSTSRNAKAPTSPAPSLTGAADLGLAAEHALPDNIERIPFSEDRLVLVAARDGRTGEPAAGRFQRGGGARFRRPDHLDRAACPCQPDTPRGSARACAFARG